MFKLYEISVKSLSIISIIFISTLKQFPTISKDRSTRCLTLSYITYIRINIDSSNSATLVLSLTTDYSVQNTVVQNTDYFVSASKFTVVLEETFCVGVYSKIH